MDTIVYKFQLGYPSGPHKGVMYYNSNFFENETKNYSEPSCDFLGLIFNLGSEIKIQLAGNSERSIGRNQFNLMYLPKESSEFTFTQGRHDSFCIKLQLSYLHTIVATFPILESFLDKVDQRIPLIMNVESFEMTPNLRIGISDVIHNKYSGELRDVYLESKFLDIIIQSFVHREKESWPGFDETDIQKIKQAHTRITEDTQRLPTVSLLADELDIDQRKLERGFKILFNTTVYNFIVEERMKKAVVLLRDTTMSISGIGTLVGYSNLRTFSKIFKRRFGYPPKELRKGENS
jgi:AraC-like DNA-binding protein